MFPQFDPSKMDPKLMMDLSKLIQQLPPEKLNQMQVMMHNMMAGIDVRKEMEEFEKSLPPGFREKIFSLMASSGMNPLNPTAEPNEPILTEGHTMEESSQTDQNAAPLDFRNARLTLLRAVASGQISPEEAEKLL